LEVELLIGDDSGELERVLFRINNDVADWFGAPATGANDRAVTGDFPLHKVAIWGDVRGAEILLRNGADVNARGEDDDTPIQRAITGGSVEMVRYLLEQGADIDLRNRYGLSARDDILQSELNEIRKLV
jgi:ankyrin repeat protein